MEIPIYEEEQVRKSMVFEDNTEEVVNEYPDMQKHGDIFLIPGANRDIIVKPKSDECSLCKVKNRTNWCRHLVAAGRKLSPPLLVTPITDGTKGLSHLLKYMRDRSSNTGKKKPKSNDYKDKNMEKLPNRAPYRFSKNFFPVSTMTVMMEEEIEHDVVMEKEIFVDKEKVNDKVKKHNVKRGSKRCENCEGCSRRNDCLECKECRDKKVNGGPGILKHVL